MKEKEKKERKSQGKEIRQNLVLKWEISYIFPKSVE